MGMYFLGQEDNTMNMDGDIKITPFNLKEEQVRVCSGYFINNVCLLFMKIMN